MAIYDSIDAATADGCIVNLRIRFFISYKNVEYRNHFILNNIALIIFSLYNLGVCSDLGPIEESSNFRERGLTCFTFKQDSIESNI